MTDTWLLPDDLPPLRERTWGEPDPKRVRVRLRGDALRDLKATKRGPCRVCGILDEYPGVTIHHLVPSSVGGDDVAANLIPLCGDGSRGCHGIVTSHSPGFPDVAARIRATLLPDEEAYVVRTKGRDWLDRYYPKGENDAA